MANSAIERRTKLEKRAGAKAAKLAGKQHKRFLKKLVIGPADGSAVAEPLDDTPRTQMPMPPTGDVNCQGLPLIPEQVKKQAAVADAYYVATYQKLVADLARYDAQLLENLLKSDNASIETHKARFEVCHAIVTHLKRFTF